MSLSLDKRAGHTINHARARRIHDKRLARFCGFLDPSQRLYQWGGQLGKNVYWKRRLVPLGTEEWAQIVNEVDTIEFIDAETRCYRVDIETAKQYKETFDGGAGLRVGIPLGCFEVYDANDKLVEPRDARYRREPVEAQAKPAEAVQLALV